ncbi:SPOR domain-containing protein [Tatumella terrea]|uniref:SPOR domain-containing protein n=1 Tax=Tatumella terrea TaxID=419007 RepID=A0ABW1VW35_9GAMM
MASKFQNRLVGTVILVAIGVIVLPGLLDGKKKHYQEEFAAIPLVPKPGDQQDNDLVPPVTQPLTAAPAASAAAGSAASAAANAGTVTPDSSHGDSVPPAPDRQSPVTDSSTVVSPSASSQAEKLRQQQQQQQQQAERQKQAQLARERQAEERARQQAADAATKAKARQAQQERERARALQALNDQSSAPQPQSKPETPSGQAWVIQLGALKNAARVSEIVAQLRSAGFRAYSLPAEPVQGEINRILVGPDSSKSHLQSQVAELKSKTGLSGVIRPYSAR